MERQDLIERLIMEGRQENLHQHEQLHGQIQNLRDEVQGLKVWRARVMGTAAGVSGLISAAGWVLSKMVWGG